MVFFPSRIGLRKHLLSCQGATERTAGTPAVSRPLICRRAASRSPSFFLNLGSCNSISAKALWAHLRLSLIGVISFVHGGGRVARPEARRAWLSWHTWLDTESQFIDRAHRRTLGVPHCRPEPPTIGVVQSEATTPFTPLEEMPCGKNNQPSSDGFSKRYRLVAVLRKIARPAMAGEAMHSSFIRFTAMRRNVRDGSITVTTPSRLTK